MQKRKIFGIISCSSGLLSTLIHLGSYILTNLKPTTDYAVGDYSFGLEPEYANIISHWVSIGLRVTIPFIIISIICGILAIVHSHKEEKLTGKILGIVGLSLGSLQMIGYLIIIGYLMVSIVRIQ